MTSRDEVLSEAIKMFCELSQSDDDISKLRAKVVLAALMHFKFGDCSDA